jgi:glutamate formiminotransferase
MPRPLIECVPNFSEGRDAATLAAIAQAVRSVPGVALLGSEADIDHNRSVFTFAGAPDAVAEAAVRAVERAAALIDLTRHTGAHPRIGAADVVPLVPIEGITLEECARLAVRVGEEIWKRARVPVYFYEASARRPERVNLADIRRGGFEALRVEMGVTPGREPDVGGPFCHPTAGAVVVGARRFLVAYNILLDTPDVSVAKRIARSIRQSSGGFACVKALGLLLTSRNLAQVSINLTDLEHTPPHVVFDAVREQAEQAGVRVLSSELIGFVPKRALESAAGHYLHIENFTPARVLENRLAEAIGPAVFADFLNGLTPRRARAAALAMAAALAAHAAREAGPEAAEFEADQRAFAEAAEAAGELSAARLAAFRERLENQSRSGVKASEVESALALLTFGASIALK